MLTLLIVPFFNFDIRLVNAYNPNDCHFAQAYSSESLFSSSTLQEEFLLQASWWQGVFARNGLAVELASGLTNLGLSFDVDTWTPNYWTFTQEKAGFIRNGDAMSEAVHLALTAAALNGDRFAREFFRSSKWTGWTIDDYLLDQLQRKIRTYNSFAEQYPGYGGYWPRLDVVHRSDWGQDPEAMLHAGDFGHWVWSLTAVAQVLFELDQTSLAISYREYVQRLAANGLVIFHHEVIPNRYGGIVKQIRVNDTGLPVTRSNYIPICPKSNSSCFLGQNDINTEAFLVFLTLFGNGTLSGGEELWQNNRQKLKSAWFLHAKDLIVVEQGVHFVANELMKYLFLPYLDIPICEAVFLNGERARTIYSHENRYPGLFASTDHYYKPGTVLRSRHTFPGIPAVAKSTGTITVHDIVAPYATFSLFLHAGSRRYGIVWYATMLNSTRVQTSVGSVEAIKTTGDFTTTSSQWTTNPVLILAVAGGIGNLTRRFLNVSGQLQRFYDLFEQRYSATFGRLPLSGSEIAFALPSAELPNIGNASTCNADLRSLDCPFWLVADFCIEKRDVILLTDYIIGLAFVILVLYIGIVKHHHKERGVHKWFTIHLFAVHFFQLTTGIALLYIELKSSYDWKEDIWDEFNDWRRYIQRYYLPHSFTLMMSGTLFAISSATYFPVFYQRWMKNSRNWHIYMVCCNLVAFFVTIPGFDHNRMFVYQIIDKHRISYVEILTVFLYVNLFGMAILALSVLLRMRLQLKDRDNSTRLEYKTLLSILIYTIVPTIWCLGSQFTVNDFIILYAYLSYSITVDSTEVVQKINALEQCEDIFRSTYAIAHSMATLLALAPYRRTLYDMTWYRLRKKREISQIVIVTA